MSKSRSLTAVGSTPFALELRNLGIREFTATDLAMTGASTDYFPKAGGSAFIFTRCLVPEHQSKVAVKVLKPNIAAELQHYGNPNVVKKVERTNKKLKREAGAFIDRQPGHRNLVKLKGFVDNWEAQMPGLIFTWYDHGDLLNYVTTHKKSLKISDRLNLLRDVASGLAYLHSRQVIHRDLKAENVLVDDRGVALIADFGFSKALQGEALISMSSSVNMSLQWTPPEYVRGSKEAWHQPVPGADMWSFGCTFLEVLRAKYPYSPLDDDEVLRSLLSSSPTGPPKPSDKELRIDDRHWLFMRGCWKLKPQDRPSAETARATLTEWIGSESFV